MEVDSALKLNSLRASLAWPLKHDAPRKTSHTPCAQYIADLLTMELWTRTGSLTTCTGAERLFGQATGKAFSPMVLASGQYSLAAGS